ncbi:hypothetical protein GCM10020000_85330 [Streptomyces olivoverticillatus]
MTGHEDWNHESVVSWWFAPHGTRMLEAKGQDSCNLWRSAIHVGTNSWHCLPGVPDGDLLEGMKPSGSLRAAGCTAVVGTAGPVWSHRAAWGELLVPVSVESGRNGLDLGEGLGRPVDGDVEDQR